MVEAVAAKPAQKAKRERAPTAIETLFMASRATTERGKNGKMVTYYHHIGSSGKSPTREDLLEVSGYAAQLQAFKKKAHNSRAPLRVIDEDIRIRKKHLNQCLDNDIAKAKRYIAKDYASQKLKPLIGWLQLQSDEDEPRLVFAGLADRMTSELVIGVRDDGALWSANVIIATNGLASVRKMAIVMAQELKTHRLGANAEKRLGIALNSRT